MPQPLSVHSLNSPPNGSFFGNRLYILACIVLSFPLYMMINAYVNAIGVHEDELVSFMATLFFIIGIFSGRFMAQFWGAALSAPRQPIFLLVVLDVASISWLFFHADFPLNNRAAINLLLFWVPFVIVSLCTGLVIKLVRILIQRQLREAQTQAAVSQSELQQLQSQLSPHFLFNTLNNLYGLSLTQHEKIPPLLLKLSELLRYAVYDASQEFVPLQDELAYISNYIEFEKIRIGERLVLTTDIEEITSGTIRIAPMLLIVFIENAFKHSKNTAQEFIYIEIKLKTWGNSILFSVKNSFRKVEDKSMTDRNSGFGLATVTRRLELQYRNEHELTIRNEEPEYLVMLQLKTT